LQAVSQHTPLAQNPEAQTDGSVQSAPIGFGVFVGVAVCVFVGVRVGVAVFVGVAVQVGCIERPHVVQVLKTLHAAGGVQSSPMQHG
jgi:Na+/H+ antiporter NhaA